MFVEKLLNGCVEVLFKKKNYTPPNSYFLGLSYTSINDDGTGINEPTPDTGYERYEIINNSDNWSDPINGEVRNLLVIIMNTIMPNIGIVTHWFLSESKTGNAVIYNKFEEPKTVTENSNVYIEQGELIIAINNVI